jgi:hypothetical protein
MTGGQSQLWHRVVVLGRQHMQSGGPVRQPYVGVDFISPVRIYELGYSFADSELCRGGLPGELVPDPTFSTSLTVDSSLIRYVVCIAGIYFNSHGEILLMSSEIRYR